MNVYYIIDSKEKSKYENITLKCKLCEEIVFFKNIPTCNLETKLCLECIKIHRRDARNRRKAKLSLKA